jgi:hypothetical protein
MAVLGDRQRNTHALVLISVVEGVKFQLHISAASRKDKGSPDID